MRALLRVETSEREAALFFTSMRVRLEPKTALLDAMDAIDIMSTIFAFSRQESRRSSHNLLGIFAAGIEENFDGSMCRRCRENL
eukprot:1030893-Prorocentrum_minimum.AAC.3